MTRMPEKIPEKSKILKTFEISKDWIDAHTAKPGWQRSLYPARVNSFINHIKKGTFVKSIITVAFDEKKNKFIVLDGQHKLEAIKKTGVSLEMDFIIYQGINSKEMMQIYNMLNDVKHPKLIDDLRVFIHGYKDKRVTRFLDRNQFPILVTEGGGVNSIRIDTFFNILSNGLCPIRGRNNLVRNSLSAFVNKLDDDTYADLKEFFSVYAESFGQPAAESWVYKNPVVFILMRIWFANKKFTKHDDFVASFKKLEADPALRQLALVCSGKTSIIIELTNGIYKALNKKRFYNKFIIFWEEDLVI